MGEYMGPKTKATPDRTPTRLERLQSELDRIAREQKAGAFGLYGKKLEADRKRIEAEIQPLRIEAERQRVAAAAQARREEEEKRRVRPLDPARFRKAAEGEVTIADTASPVAPRISGLAIGAIIKRAP